MPIIGQLAHKVRTSRIVQINRMLLKSTHVPVIKTHLMKPSVNHFHAQRPLPFVGGSCFGDEVHGL
jgi:hypothetical protein